MCEYGSKRGARLIRPPYVFASVSLHRTLFLEHEPGRWVVFRPPPLRLPLRTSPADLVRVTACGSYVRVTTSTFRLCLAVCTLGGG